MSILDHVPPGYVLRDVQRSALLEIERKWEEYDVFVLQLPVAAGKSLLAMIISAWQNSLNKGSAILTPQVILQEQYHRDFPHVPLLKGKARYSCKKCLEWRQQYPDYDEIDCSDCNFTYRRAVNLAQRSPSAILNFHSYLYNQVYKPLLIVDEAHNLVSMLTELYSLKIWQHKAHYPDNMDTKDDLIPWLQSECDRLEEEIGDHRGMPTPEIDRAKGRLKKYRLIIEGMMTCKEQFFLSKSIKPYRGKNYEVLEARPITLDRMPHNMWPRRQVDKMVFMSATINELDIERLGLSKRQVCYITSESPIPLESRPIFVEGVADMGYNNVKESTKIIAERIKELASEHHGKGFVHITYSLIPELRKHLRSKRYIWHTKDDKEERYNEFRASKNGIMMAAGMSEGVDLRGAEYEWQAIAKVVFPSVAEPINKYYLSNAPEIYNYETVKTIVQQYGRICRSPDDHGVTYILDKLFKSMYIRNVRLFPDYFKHAIRWRR